MGCWFKDFFLSRGFDVIVSDYGTKLSNSDLASRSDIVIVSVPLLHTKEVIEEVKENMREDALLCDIASLKKGPVSAMKDCRSECVGIHPLFGPLASSLKGQNVVFCSAGKEGELTDFMKSMFKKEGAEIIEIDAQEHDKQMALIQALVHFANISLARTITLHEINDSFLTPVFRLQSLILGRVLSQSPDLYAELEIGNPYFPEIMREFEDQVRDLARKVEEKDREGFKEIFKKTSSSLEGFKKVAEAKSNEVLSVVESQPVRTRAARGASQIKGALTAFLGPEGTFSHQAANTFSDRHVACSTIRDVFEAVNSGRVEIGVVPAENTTEGVVSETINCLIDYPLKVAGSCEISISQCFFGDKEKVRVIETHPQAFRQCRRWVERNLPGVQFKESSSTTAPMKEERGEETGFIAPRIAGEVYDMSVSEEGIEDNKDNITKFYFIARDVKHPSSGRTLLLLAVYDRVGVLRDILHVFAQHELNLTSLHSVPSHLRPWDYYFFLEVDAVLNEKVTKELERYCSMVRVMGSS